MANHDAHFDIERRRFFYIDEFPENDRRFDFTLDDLPTLVVRQLGVQGTRAGLGSAETRQWEMELTPCAYWHMSDLDLAASIANARSGP